VFNCLGRAVDSYLTFNVIAMVDHHYLNFLFIKEQT
jgi:hypothetical protein